MWLDGSKSFEKRWRLIGVLSHDAIHAILLDSRLLLSIEDDFLLVDGLTVSNTTTTLVVRYAYVLGIPTTTRVVWIL